MSDAWGVVVRDALRLALGRPVPVLADWPSVLNVARAERLLGIAWLRSGPLIRATAPASVVAMWRTAALDLDERARSQLDTLVRLNELLTAHGVNAIVLKGPPLSVRLYGEVGARHSVDLDLLVVPDARVPARHALESAGWTKWLGEPPWDECFYRRRDNQAEYLEMHSHLPGEALSHCPLCIEGQHFEAAAGALVVPGGSALPVYLAGNMAKHGALPLSAVVDFDTLWSSLEASEREATLEIAREARLFRCLRWAVEQTTLLTAAAHGRPEALRELGVGAGAREFGHAYLRLIRLADHTIDVARIAGAWVWPRSSRGSWRGLGMVWNRRFHKPFKDVGAFRQTYVGS